ncbi:hypothetical protein V8E36_006137, partial [Tilletia maclaganii]
HHHRRRRNAPLPRPLCFPPFLGPDLRARSVPLVPAFSLSTRLPTPPPAPPGQRRRPPRHRSLGRRLAPLFPPQRPTLGTAFWCRPRLLATRSLRHTPSRPHPPIFATRPPPILLVKSDPPTPLHSPPRFGPSPPRDEPAHAPSSFTSHHAVDPSPPTDTLTLSPALNPPPGAGPSARTPPFSLHPSQALTPALLLPTSPPCFPPHQLPARATSARRPRGLPLAAPHPHVPGWAPSTLPPAALSLSVCPRTDDRPTRVPSSPARYGGSPLSPA